MTIERPGDVVLPMNYFRKGGEEFYLEKADGHWVVSCLREGGTKVAWTKKFRSEDRAREEFNKHK